MLVCTLSDMVKVSVTTVNIEDSRVWVRVGEILLTELGEGDILLIELGEGDILLIELGEGDMVETG